jgi:hypothetical protein
MIEQQAEQMRFQIEREKLEAERKRIEAEGIRDVQQIISEGRASCSCARSRPCATSPGLPTPS